jgi:protein phosphatase
MLQAREAVTVHSFGDSYIGRRRNNEDCLGKREPVDLGLRGERGCLYVVSDGMGGHAAGEVASLIAVETVLKEYYADTADHLESLVAAVQKANERIYIVAEQEPDKEGMGCTVVACVIVDGKAIIAHVGDSRAYHVRNGHLQLLTRDHLHLIENLDISEEEAKRHRLRHMLSRALGSSAEVQADTTVVPCEPGDRFLLCTDGLSNAVPESEILEALRGPTPREAAAKLLQRAEALEADDNTSVIIVDVMPAEAAPLSTVDATEVASVPTPQGVEAPPPPVGPEKEYETAPRETDWVPAGVVAESFAVEDEEPRVDARSSVVRDTPLTEGSPDRPSGVRRWWRFLRRDRS